MANLSIKDFPDELLREGRIEALAAGTTFRELVIGALERVVSDRQGEGARPSLDSHRRVPSKRRAKKQVSTADDMAPTTIQPDPAQQEDPAEPCRHGLIFHPGCNMPPFSGR
jgi:hypothetical protein